MIQPSKPTPAFNVQLARGRFERLLFLVMKLSFAFAANARSPPILRKNNLLRVQ